MAKKIQKRSFDDVLSALGTQHFDVAPAHDGVTRRSGVMRVSKNGCAAEIADGQGGPVMLLQKPGWLLNGEIARLLDRGYQKFIKSSKLEIPATAEKLRELHAFSRELDAITGETALYNDALGTTSDVYLYDRVAGRLDVKP